MGHVSLWIHVHQEDALSAICHADREIDAGGGFANPALHIYNGDSNHTSSLGLLARPGGAQGPHPQLPTTLKLLNHQLGMRHIDRKSTRLNSSHVSESR